MSQSAAKTYTLKREEVEALTNHPAADLFPMMTLEEMEALGQDVEAAGLLEPIILTGNRTQVLDGRNRLQVCKTYGVAPIFKDWDHEGSDPVAWVLSINLNRRHLTLGQRTAIAVEAKELIQKLRMEATGTTTALEAQRAGRNAETNTYQDQGGKARDIAAKGTGVHPTGVDRLDDVRKASPELFAEVKAGKMSVRGAQQEVKAEAAGKTPLRNIVLGPIWDDVLSKLAPGAASVARRLERESPELAHRVLNGDLGLFAAKKILDEEQGKTTNAEHRRNAERRAKEAGDALLAEVQNRPRAEPTSRMDETAEVHAFRQYLPKLRQAVEPMLKADRDMVVREIIAGLGTGTFTHLLGILQEANAMTNGKPLTVVTVEAGA